MNIKKEVLNLKCKWLICLLLFFCVSCVLLVFHWRTKEDACSIASNANKNSNNDDARELIFDLSSSETSENDEISSDDRLSTDVAKKDLEINSKSFATKCKNATFGLPGMDACHQWLNCSNLANEIKIVREIGRGAVKKVFLGVWRGNFLVISTPVMLNDIVLYENDFKNGLNFVIQHSPNDYLVQLVGFCHHPLAIVTEYHRLGDAAQFLGLLESESFRRWDTVKTRFQLCLDYVDILVWLHSDTNGNRVMCDSNDLKKTLEQYLLTDDFRLLLNDVDALPSVNHSTKELVKCGHRQLFGDFVAPEQRWPYDQPYDDNLMPPYDEKTDIWKIPDVCQYFLHGARDESILLYHLFAINKKCKSENPVNRPTAEDVLKHYRDIWKTLAIS